MKDNVDFPLLIHNFCRLTLELRQEASSTFPRNLMKCSASQFTRLTLRKFGLGFFNKFIKFSGLKIRTDFLIPKFIFKLKESVSKL